MAISSSRPKRVNFLVKQGDTFRRVFTFQTKDIPPVNVDQSTATFKFIIDGEDDLTIGDGLEISGVDDHQVIVSKDIDWAGERKYEFERVMNGITWTICAGKLKSKDELEED